MRFCSLKKYLFGVKIVAFKIVKCGDYRERRNFSKIRNTYELKDLLEIQKKSYNWFVETGIKEVFEDLFPVENFSGTLSLEFGDYHFDEPRFSIKESKDRESTYSAPLKVDVRLFNHETGEVKEQGAKSLITDMEKEYNVEILEKKKGFFVLKCTF